MRRKFYGKPLPAKRQVRAHLNLLQLIKEEKKMGISFDETECRYLRRLVFADQHRMICETDHAVCYGTEVVLNPAAIATSILLKIDAERIDVAKI